MSNVKENGDAISVEGTEKTLVYGPRAVTLRGPDDDLVIAHESQGGNLASVWAGDLGECYVEVVHLGDGPIGGELIVVVPSADTVILGDLFPGENPDHVPPSWAAALDLAIGLTTKSTIILTSRGRISRDELDASHQQLLGILNA